MKSITAAASLAIALQPVFAIGLYRENFNDGRAQFWSPQHPREFTIVASELGNLHYRGAAEPTGNKVVSQVSTLASPPLRNFSYAVRLANNGIRPTYLIFRATSDFFFKGNGRRGTGYAFGIDCEGDGAFYFYKVLDGDLQTIKSWSSAPLKCSGNIDDPDELRIVARGSLFMLSVNGKEVFRYTDPAPIASGRVGLYNISDDSNATYSDFDHIVIGTAPDGMEALPSPDERSSAVEDRAAASLSDQASETASADDRRGPEGGVRR